MVVIYAWGSAILLDEALPGDLPLLRTAERVYLLGLIPLEVYCTFGHVALMGARLPFAPLMLTSAYCALGVCYAWAVQARRFVRLATESWDSPRKRHSGWKKVQ